MDGRTSQGRLTKRHDHFHFISLFLPSSCLGFFLRLPPCLSMPLHRVTFLLVLSCCVSLSFFICLDGCISSFVRLRFFPQSRSFFLSVFSFFPLPCFIRFSFCVGFVFPSLHLFACSLFLLRSSSSWTLCALCFLFSSFFSLD